MTLAQELNFLAAVESWDWPEDAGATIVAGLGSDDSELRRTALEIAVGAMDDEVAGALLALLDSEPDPELRGRAAIALGPALEECRDEEGFEGPFSDAPLSDARFSEVERRLERLYRDAGAPKLVRRRALEAAVRSDRPWQEGAVRSAWASDDTDWRVTAVFCMGLFPGFRAEIAEALGNGVPELELEAVRAAGSRGIEELGGEIYRLAAGDGTEREMRLAAVEALGTTNPPEAQELLEKYVHSADEELAGVAEEALENLYLAALADSELDDLEDFDAFDDSDDDFLM